MLSLEIGVGSSLMNKIILFLVLLFNFNALADDREQYQSALMSEYQSLLTKDTFNQDRINEIETIALENPYYELRQWIALSYSTKSEVRELNPENSNPVDKPPHPANKSIIKYLFVITIVT